MTKLQDNRPIVRKTGALYRRRTLIITLTPRVVEIHQERCRDKVGIEYAALYEMLLKWRWRKEQGEKLARKSRKGE